MEEGNVQELNQNVQKRPKTQYECVRAWKLAHPEQVKEQRRRHRQLHREEKNAYERQWRARKREEHDRERTMINVG